MIYEVGYVLGFYYVFKGVSERESCDDFCRETVSFMDTGDFCVDIVFIFKSKLCRDLEFINDICGFIYFLGVLFSNYMSYIGIIIVLTYLFFKIVWGFLRVGYVEVEVWEVERVVK